ncbi:hypothetical protein RIF29_46986 [Crotalaria pallida]|uniref:Uncharacterized protein n=1 Tax=Crotalaria pallida TaxID=3830 RepID=A0AAN9DR38_CROPI
MILCSFSPWPDDALLARGATYQKKTLSITLRRESTSVFLRHVGSPIRTVTRKRKTNCVYDHGLFGKIASGRTIGQCVTLLSGMKPVDNGFRNALI